MVRGTSSVKVCSIDRESSCLLIISTIGRIMGSFVAPASIATSPERALSATLNLLSNGGLGWKKLSIAWVRARPCGRSVFVKLGTDGFAKQSLGRCTALRPGRSSLHSSTFVLMKLLGTGIQSITAQHCEATKRRFRFAEKICIGHTATMTLKTSGAGLL